MYRVAWLGSTVGMLDGTGTLAGTAHTWPYGAARSATGVLAGTAAGTDKRYTGQQQQPADAAFGDTTLGLYNYHARFYSTLLGRFVSADPTGDGLDRFAYADNNPVRYVDPTGLCFTFSWGSGAGQSVTFSCGNDDDLTNWIKCALSCDNWIGDIARFGLGTGEFWGNFDKHFEADKQYGTEYVLVGHTLETIVQNARLSTLDAIQRADLRIWLSTSQ